MKTVSKKITRARMVVNSYLFFPFSNRTKYLSLSSWKVGSPKYRREEVEYTRGDWRFSTYTISRPSLPSSTHRFITWVWQNFPGDVTLTTINARCSQHPYNAILCWACCGRRRVAGATTFLAVSHQALILPCRRAAISSLSPHLIVFFFVFLFFDLPLYCFLNDIDFFSSKYFVYLSPGIVTQDKTNIRVLSVVYK